jgi:hypothetical protein
MQREGEGGEKKRHAVTGGEWGGGKVKPEGITTLKPYDISNLKWNKP